MQHFANPARFLAFTRPIWPAALIGGAALTALGLGWGLFGTPPDYQQGQSAKIMYVHVPAAWMAMFVYMTMASASLVGFVWKHPVADMTAKSAAPIGAAFTGLALVTGALWGKPTWGTYWVWDARLTSVLVLFFMYLGYIALWEAIEDQRKAARAAAILALVGVVNIPIIKFSVDWWNSLHQPASISSLERIFDPAIHPSMLWPLLIVWVGYMVLFVGLVLVRTRSEILARRLERLRLQHASQETRVRDQDILAEPDLAGLAPSGQFKGGQFEGGPFKGGQG
ncbi:MAG: heme ABC transporter permease [Pseudomonadota bacterium]